jgi:DNA-binding FrmR family transcriptional regulator
MMSLAARRRVQLIYRSKRIAGQFDMIYRGLLLNMQRSEILDRVAAARLSVNDLMVRLLEEEVLDRPRDDRGKTQAEIVDGMMKLLQSYLQ